MEQQLSELLSSLRRWGDKQQPEEWEEWTWLCHKSHRRSDWGQGLQTEAEARGGKKRDQKPQIGSEELTNKIWSPQEERDHTWWGNNFVFQKWGKMY